MSSFSALENRRVILNSRPKGVPSADHFTLQDGPVSEPGEGQVLIRNLYLSVDPAMRGWVNDAPNYSPPVPIGDVMRSFAVGEVVASRDPAFSEGDIVHGLFGWQSFALLKGSDIGRKVLEADLSPSLALGVLGLNGITAYFGLLDVCAPEAGETVVVSTAAGSVGSSVGQIAKITGCRTVGIAGGPDKTALCREAFGYDEAIDYKAAGDLNATLQAACPDGADVYFDNTCGPISDAVMCNLALRARIVICGTAAVTDWDPLPLGPRVHRQLLVKRARIQGFLVFDYQDRAQEAIAQLADWVRSGQLNHREHVLEGLARAPGAIGMLYRGENHGKLLIRVD